MPSFARVTLLGHAGRDGEEYSSKGGKTFYKFSLAVSSGKRGEEKTSWFPVWIEQKETYQHDVRKGQLVFVEGRINLDKGDEEKTGKYGVSATVWANIVVPLEVPKKDDGPKVLSESVEIPF